MDRSRVFFDFDASWVVHEDADLLVVDKPEGIPSQAADTELPDDLLTRARRHFGAPGGEEPYFGTHQRLDRDTSGLFVLARTKAANPALAAQFEGRKVKKRYLAVVEGKTPRQGVTLVDHLVRGQDGRMECVRPGTRGALRAETRVRVVERHGGRALVELDLVTGRTHQARVQLAHAGMPIAGDGLYGGAPAERLMLHAAGLDLSHPTTGRALRLASPAPREMREWLVHGDVGARVYDDPRALRGALARAVRRRYGLGRSTGARETTAFRLVNEAGDGLPRLAVDVYGDFLVAQLYDDDGGVWADAARRDRVLDALAELGFDGVYLKVRPRQANTLVDTRRDDLAPRLPVRGSAAPDPLVVREEGMPVAVRLGDGLSTGIFLDQRSNRVRVRDAAAGKSLLNLFSYTCGFTLAAARGGAARTVSVDASTVALERGREGLALLRAEGGLPIDEKMHTFVADDAFSYLERAARKGDRFDLVVLDPPSYSTTKKRRFVAKDDYGELAALALQVVAPGGSLLASTNHRGVDKDRFRRAIAAAARGQGIELAQVKDLPEPRDYPTAAGAGSHLKSVWATRASGPTRPTRAGAGGAPRAAAGAEVSRRARPGPGPDRSRHDGKKPRRGR